MFIYEEHDAFLLITGYCAPRMNDEFGVLCHLYELSAYRIILIHITPTRLERVKRVYIEYFKSRITREAEKKMQKLGLIVQEL